MGQALVTSSRNHWLASILGVLALVVVVAVITGRKLPLINTERAGLIALLVIGMAMCTAGGIGKTINATVGWVHPINLLGYVLGALILVVAAFALLNQPILWIRGDRAAILTISVLGLIKWLNAMVFYLLFNKPA